jgi:lysyl-tRNA synthetase class 2
VALRRGHDVGVADREPTRPDSPAHADVAEQEQRHDRIREYFAVREFGRPRELAVIRREAAEHRALAHLQDGGARLQIALERESLDADTWRRFHDLFDRGDFVGAEGALFRTKKGELTLRVDALTFLGKALQPLPEKWHGLKDVELRQRRRYVDLVMSEETRARFRLRTMVVRTLRRFLDDHGFEEVETPVLQTVPSGATARPFITHHNALDLDAYLSIAPETWLKRLVVGGYDKVYEIARCFRNEGMEPTHLQEFTLLAYYCAYWNW